MNIWVVSDFDGPLMSFNSARLATEYVKDEYEKFHTNGRARRGLFINEIPLYVGYNEGRLYPAVAAIPAQ